jgi:23S rRNA (uracil1939-C5)-methyltransferase
MKQVSDTVRLEKIVGDGQALGTLANGTKVLVWGALPSEIAEVRIIKRKGRKAHAVAERIITAAPERVEPKDPDSYLSTSPWQIMSYKTEAKWKKQLVRDAFELYDVDIRSSELISDNLMYGYRNKIEFSWWQKSKTDTLELAFFCPSTRARIPVKGTSLARPEINEAARQIRDVLQRNGVKAQTLNTLVIRCSQQGLVNAQLYINDKNFHALSATDITSLNLHGFEIIYAPSKNSAVITSQVLEAHGQVFLTDTLLGTEFHYSAGGCFPVNLPVYEMVLAHIKEWVHEQPVITMYSGVGTIGLTLNTSSQMTLIEQDSPCINEMYHNIDNLGSDAQVVYAPSEEALNHITRDHTVIVNPPRGGLRIDVLHTMKDIRPPRIIYLADNPITQAHDISQLLDRYHISHTAAFNLFPRTPYTEHVIILDHI